MERKQAQGKELTAVKSNELRLDVRDLLRNYSVINFTTKHLNGVNECKAYVKLIRKSQAMLFKAGKITILHQDKFAEMLKNMIM